MEKVKKVQSELKKRELDAILVTSSINRRYLTSFTGTAGVALISQDKARFITDFRYTEQATEQAEHFDVIEHKALIHEEIKNQLNELNIKRLGFEKNQVTFATYELYTKTFDTVELIPVGDMIENLRVYKTAQELESMRQAAEREDKAYDHIQPCIKPRFTKKEH